MATFRASAAERASAYSLYQAAGVVERIRRDGSRFRVSEVLNRRRDLTIAMIARIREKLGIPADTLIGRQRAA